MSAATFRPGEVTVPVPSAGAPVSPEQVTLRLLTAADAPALLDLELRNREALLVGAPAREEAWFTEEGQRAALAHGIAEREAGRSLGLGTWLEEAAGSSAGTEGTARLVGRMTLAGITRGAFQSASLGYWVDAEVAGRGIATHASRAAIAVAFGGLGLHRLQAEVQVGNDASARVLEKCGFAEYGLAPDYLRLGDGWADCRLFQLVDSRWLPTDPAPAPPAGELVIAAEVPSLGEMLELYSAVGWSAYTEDPATLERSVLGSEHVVTARRDGELLGMARVVGDGATLAYLQDVLVRPDAHRTGIGRSLVEAAFAPFAAVRQQVLLTDAEPGQRAFYESLGFVEAHDHDPGLRAFVRLR